MQYISNKAYSLGSEWQDLGVNPQMHSQMRHLTEALSALSARERRLALLTIAVVFGCLLAFAGNRGIGYIRDLDEEIANLERGLLFQTEQVMLSLAHEPGLDWG